MREVKTITREEGVELFDLIFNQTYSDGFKHGEIKTLLTDESYRFMDKPILSFKETKPVIINWLKNNDFIVPTTLLADYI